MNHNFSLRNNNVYIRPICETDIEYLREWRNNPDNSKYLRQIGHITKEMQKKWFENYLKNEDEIAFAIEETNEICKIVGSASLYNFKGKQAEFGKILIGNKEAHGKKVGHNATVAVLKVAFDELELEKVVLECYENNLAAIRVYEASGFTLDEVKKPEGSMAIRYYSVLKEDFKRIKF